VADVSILINYQLGVLCFDKAILRSSSRRGRRQLLSSSKRRRGLDVSTRSTGYSFDVSVASSTARARARSRGLSVASYRVLA